MIGIVAYFLGINKTFRHKDTDDWVSSNDYFKPKIHIRFVTKGVNQQQTIESCLDIWKSIKVPSLYIRADWQIEVLTDNHMNLGPATDLVTQIVVPHDYVTPFNSLFKARALHYASQHFKLDDNAWILHMDEES